MTEINREGLDEIILAATREHPNLIGWDVALRREWETKATEYHTYCRDKKIPIKEQDQWTYCTVAIHTFYKQKTEKKDTRYSKYWNPDL